MRTFSLAFVASLALFFAAYALPADQAKKTDAEKLVGTWRAVQGRYDGEDLPKEFLALIRLGFGKKGQSHFSVGRWGHQDKFKLLNRGEIDLTLAVLCADDPVPSLYKFEPDGRLAICASLAVKGPRPTFFTAEKGSGRVLLILQRTTPDQEGFFTDAELAKQNETFDKLKGIERLYENIRRRKSSDNLHHIGIGFHMFLDDFKAKRFPQNIYSVDGKTPLLSWRVALLDYLEQEECSTKSFKLDEPWDSEHNKKLIPKMPGVYAAPGQDKKAGMTYYQVFTGPGTIFDAAKTRGGSLIVNNGGQALVVEAGTPVIWTKPEDVELPAENAKMPRLGGVFKDRVHFLFLGGDVRDFDPEIDPFQLRKMVWPIPD